jgi:hypothetical protein
MTTLKKIIFIASLQCSFLCISAQPNAKKEKIEVLKVAFITKKINLTSNEAQVFWPLYNELTDKLEANQAYVRQYLKSANKAEITDKEAEELINADIIALKKEAELHKEYYEKFKKILPVTKVAQLRIAEHEFRKEIIQHIKNKKGRE